MAREDVLVGTFVELVDSLVDDYDIVDFLQGLATRCVELLDVSEAGIMLVDPDDKPRHIASSSERMRLVELLELQLEEGPCLDAYRGGQAVLSGSPEDATARWPRFAPRANEAGFASMAAVPMRLRTEVIGSLNLFSTSPGELSGDDVRVAQAMADVATIGILHERAVRDARTLAAQLQVALDSRISIEQAKGIVGERNGVSVDEAFALVRGYARANNRLLTQVADDIVAGTISPTSLEGR